MSENGNWSENALQAFGRIQTVIDASAWGVFVSAQLKNDTSLERDAGISPDDMIEKNLTIIRNENPSVSVLVQNGHLESQITLIFTEFEKLSLSIDPDKIKWWPVNFASKVEWQVWLERHVQKEFSE